MLISTFRNKIKSIKLYKTSYLGVDASFLIYSYVDFQELKINEMK